MKRLLVVDDEKPVVEGISLMVRRELPGEFEVAGSASSGREAIEKAAALAPDIVIMDVRMPGISGLEAIREMRRRGLASAFVLVTAYERFDIAKEAVELGVVDYLLKPVEKGKLAGTLRAAAAFVDSRRELERREIDFREREEGLRSFAETALLHGIALGERPGGALRAYRSALGIDEARALAAVALFLPAPGAPDPESEIRALHEELRSTLRYKTRALAGPLVRGRCLILLPLRSDAEAGDLRAAIERNHAQDLARGRLRLGYGGPAPLEDAASSYADALADLMGRARPAAPAGDAAAGGGGAAGAVAPGDDRPFEDEEALLEELRRGHPDSARLRLERLLSALGTGPSGGGRLGLAALLGSACRLLARDGVLAPDEARAFLDSSAMLGSTDQASFELAALSCFEALALAVGRAPRRSPAVARALAFVAEAYGRQIGLEQAAEEIGISPNRLSKLFAEETGRGFYDYLIEYRIVRAKELLLEPGASIKAVSVRCGYPDPNYFSRLFKKMTGLTPTAFAELAAAGGEEDGDGTD